MCLYLFIFLIISLPVFSSPQQVRKDLDKFLSEYNSGSSLESPKIYKGQMAGYGTAGSLTTRNRVFNRKPLTVTPPSYSAGCAGIDAHLGSFSYISKEELIDAMKNTASNAATYAFLLTVKSVSPQAEDTMCWLQEMSNQINSMNINSCELAEQAVGASWPNAVGARQHICRSMSRQNGLLSDMAIARHKCAEDNTRLGKDPELGDSFAGSYNLAWDIISKDPFLTTQPQFAELFMSITGTIVIGDDGVPKHYPSMVNDSSFMKSLFEGGELECYLCSALGTKDQSLLDNLFKNSKGCLDIVMGKKKFSGTNSFHAETKKKLENIQISLSENTELHESDKEILMKTRLPVGRIICALTAYHRGRCPVEIATISEVVTMDIICQYLKDVVRSARATALQLKDIQFDGKPIENFIDNLRDVERVILEYETNSRNVFEEQFQFMKMLEMIENNLQKNIAL